MARPDDAIETLMREAVGVLAATTKSYFEVWVDINITNDDGGVVNGTAAAIASLLGQRLGSTINLQKRWNL